MLSDCRASAMLVAEDIKRARAFYEEELGLKVMMEMDDVVVFEAGHNTSFIVYQRPGGVTAKNTVLAFDVQNIEKLLDELKAKGVKQDLRDLPEGANEKGIVDYKSVKSAWINDTEGNIIALTERV